MSEKTKTALVALLLAALLIPIYAELFRGEDDGTPEWACDLLHEAIVAAKEAKEAKNPDAIGYATGVASEYNRIHLNWGCRPCVDWEIAEARGPCSTATSPAIGCTPPLPSTRCSATLSSR